jgi:amino acid transporter
MNSVPKKELSLFDSICIIVGIIIGAGIYETSSTVAAGMTGWASILGIWLAGGILALCGALCYAELATTYPREGGDYVYLRRAYGSWAGFLFGWSQLIIIRPGDIALMAFIFARYAQTVYAPFAHSGILFAAGAVIILTIINILGVREGKSTQNVLTVVKALGILIVIAAGLLAPVNQTLPAEAKSFSMGGFQLSLILVLFTYGGWNEMAYVAAEVKHPKRNIVRALVIGLAAVTGIYLLVTLAFLFALGPSGMAASHAIAVETVAKILPTMAGRIISILICISTLGAINGLVFTGARISYAMGCHHVAFRFLGRWSGRSGTPVWSLVMQCCLSLVIILAAGSFINTILYNAPAVWLFFFATATTVFVLRYKDPQTPRSYSVTGFPATVIVFCCCCLFMLYNCISFAVVNRPAGLILLTSILLAGVCVFLVTEKRDRYEN